MFFSIQDEIKLHATAKIDSIYRLNRGESKISDKRQCMSVSQFVNPVKRLELIGILDIVYCKRTIYMNL